MKSVHLLSPLLILLMTTPGLMSSEIDEDEESSLKRRLLQRRIATVSNAERESRSRGGAAERPELPQLVSPGCTSCESCGTSLVLQDRRARILDGIETVYGAYPWQVSIEKRGQDTGERWSHICGGSLISKYHVLTAAHCFRDTLSDYRVIVGNHYLNKTDVSEQAFEIQPGDYVNHRGFGFRSEFDNDISFIRLPSPDDRGVAFDQYVHPICLPPEEGISLTPGLRCHVSGWGTQDKRRSHKVSSILRVAQVPLQSQGECQRAYRDDLRGNYLRRLYPINRHSVITDGNFCAGGDGPDACSGDSGGPLACTLPGQPHKFFLAGIVSWGKECGSKTHPGIYTKVSHYLKWIRNEVDLSRPDRLKL